MGKYLGIDLGTTYTQACLCEKANWEKEERRLNMAIFHGQKSETRFPSMVYYPGPHDPPVAGEVAENSLEFFPGQVLRESKSQLSDNDKRWSEMTVIFPDGKEERQEAWRVSGIIIEQAISKMRNSEGQPIDWEKIRGCTITYPASFPHTALWLTKRAALKVEQLKSLEEKEKGALHFLPEPIAAFIGLDQGVKKNNFQKGDTVLVVDIGAGTTDTTIIKIEEMGVSFPKLKILEVGEHVLQGGNNYDKVISEYLCQRIWPEIIDSKILNMTDKTVLDQTLKQFRYHWDLLARKIKLRFVAEEDEDDIDLIEDEYISESCLNLIVDGLKIPKKTKIRINSKELNDVLLKSIKKPTGATLFNALEEIERRYKSSQNKSTFEPSSILLAGGGANVKAVQIALGEKYKGVKPIVIDYPQNLIARGASIYASISDIEKDLLEWPINQDVYLMVQDINGKKTWENILDRHEKGDEYFYIMTKSDEKISLEIGTGYFDKVQNIDWVNHKDSYEILLPRIVSKGEGIIIKTGIDLDDKPYMVPLLENDNNLPLPVCQKISLEYKI
jgi:molecular chaperone DnaK (HSP70)